MASGGVQAWSSLVTMDSCKAFARCSSSVSCSPYSLCRCSCSLRWFLPRSRRPRADVVGGADPGAQLWGDRVLPARSRRAGALRLATAGFVHSSDCGFGQARRWRGGDGRGLSAAARAQGRVRLIKTQGPGAIGVSIPSSKGASEGTVMTIASDLVVAVFVVAVRRRLLLRLRHRSVALHLGVFGRGPPFVLSELAVGQK